MEIDDIHAEAYRLQKDFIELEEGQHAALHRQIADAVIFTRDLLRTIGGVEQYFKLPYFQERTYAPNPEKLTFLVLCFNAKATMGSLKYKRASVHATAVDDLVKDNFLADEDVLNEINRWGNLEIMAEEASARAKNEKFGLFSLDIEGDEELVAEALNQGVGAFLKLRVQRVHDGAGGWRRFFLRAVESETVEDF